jgi:hypothetical protein
MPSTDGEGAVFERMLATIPLGAVVTAARDEARRRGDRRVGTEHLLLGLLRDPGAGTARALGVDLASARAALDALDRAALASIGIDLDGLPPAGVVAARAHPPVTAGALTSGARAALGQAVKATRANTRRLAPNYLLLALLACQRPDPVAALIEALGIDRSAVRDRAVPPARRAPSP